MQTNRNFLNFAACELRRALLCLALFSPALIVALTLFYNSGVAVAQVQRYNAPGNERASDQSGQRRGYLNGDSYSPRARATVGQTPTTIPRSSHASRPSFDPQPIGRASSPSGVVRLRETAPSSSSSTRAIAPPTAISTSSSSSVPQSGVGSRVTARAPKEAKDARARSGAYLSQKNGRYDFLRIVDSAELDDLVRESGGLCVVTPHKNFIFPTVKEGEKKEGERATTTVDLVGATSAPVPDDYVVFILTNLDPDERSLLLDAADGAWDSVSLLDAALIAEGLTTREKRARYCARFESLLSTLTSQTRTLQDELMKTEKVYTFLHSYALYAKYDLNCSSVAASLDSGVFNCVSATVLFNCFASRVGLEVAALETTGHAKSRVKYADSFLDLETTCTNWDRLPDRMRPYASKDSVQVNLGVSDELTQSSDASATLNLVSFNGTRSKSNATGAEEGSTTFTIDKTAPLGYSFTRSRRPMREITDVELVATIYYNVGVDYYQSGDYERAIASYIKAIQLAPNNRTILGNLKATLNNWAIDVAMKERRYATAIQLTDLGTSLDPNFNEFKLNLPIFFHDWIEYLGKDNKLDEIKMVQDEYRRRFPQ